jgi:hypothetical protein
MMSFPDFCMNVLQGLWGFWPLIFLAGFEGAEGWRTRKKEDNLNLLKRILLNLLIAWSIFAVLWILIMLLNRAPTSFILPNTLNYSLFWMVGIGLVGLEALPFVLKYAQSFARENLTSLADLQALSPDEFEQLVAETYRAFGYDVQFLDAQGDHEIDLLLRSSTGEKSVVQCKRWRGNVGQLVIRDFYGAMRHAGAVEGAIITTGAFTSQAREWAKDKAIHLYNGEQFLRVLYRAQSMNDATATAGRSLPNRQTFF